jgi:hypothetical protein
MRRGERRQSAAVSVESGTEVVRSDRRRTTILSLDYLRRLTDSSDELAHAHTVRATALRITCTRDCVGLL